MITKGKKRLFFPLLTIMASVLLMVCSSDAKSPGRNGDLIILAFGNSLTFGTGAAPTESYPAVLARLIGQRVVNAGVPGEVTAEALSRLPMTLEQAKPTVLILCHGANDLLRRLKQRPIANNLREMIRLAQERGIVVVLIAVPSLGIALSPPSFYREIAMEMRVPIEENILEAVLSDRSLMSDDIHPNAAGYRRLAESIAALLKKSGAVKGLSGHHKGLSLKKDVPFFRTAKP